MLPTSSKGFLHTGSGKSTSRSHDSLSAGGGAPTPGSQYLLGAVFIQPLSFIGHCVSMLCLCRLPEKFTYETVHGPISPSHVLQCVVGVCPKASKSLPNPCICSSGISQLTATPGQRLRNILYSFSPTHSGIFLFSLVVRSIFHGLQRDPMEMFPNLLTPLLQASVCLIAKTNVTLYRPMRPSEWVHASQHPASIILCYPGSLH